MFTGRRNRTIVSAILLLAIVPACTTTEAPPNLVIVMVDTLRPDHLGYHGYALPTSPQIDALAGRATVFMNHHSHSSRTGPAVASVFTGLHPRSHGVLDPLTHFDSRGTLAATRETLAETLKDNGYGCFGYVGNPNVSPRFGFSQGFDRYELLTPGVAPEVNRLADEAMGAQGGPFFMYLHYMEPHSSYRAPELYREMFVTPGYSGPITGEHKQLDDIVAGRFRPGRADVNQLEALYDQEIRYFDDMFGELLGSIERHGLADNTIVVFMSDHGEEFLDHGSALHGYTLYQEQLRVPMFIYDPRREGATRVDALTRHVDFLSTILDVLGISAATPQQGVSLVPWMEGRETSAASGPVYAQVSLRAVKTVDVVSFEKGGWKIIVNKLPEQTYELYRVNEDPGEQRNLRHDDPAITQLVGDQLMKFEKSLPRADVQTVDLTDEEVKRLKSLGYIQ